MKQTVELPQNFTLSQSIRALQQHAEDRKRDAATNADANRQLRKMQLLDQLQEREANLRLGMGGSAGTSSQRRIEECAFQKLLLKPVMKLERRPRLGSAGSGNEELASKGKEQLQSRIDEDEEGLEEELPALGPSGGGRGGRTSAKKGGGTSMTQKRVSEKKKKLEKGTVVIIPLGNERMRVSEIRKKLKGEYAARYCEALNVAPSQQNMNFLLKNMPLENCKISQVFHPGLARGERRNYIAIEPGVQSTTASNNTKKRPSSPQSREEAFQSIVPAELVRYNEELLKKEQEERFASYSANLAASRGAAFRQSMNRSATAQAKQAIRFEEYKNKFVFPFCLGAKFETRPKSGEGEDEEGATEKEGVEHSSALRKARSGGHQEHSDSKNPRLEAYDALLAKVRSVQGPSLAISPKKKSDTEFNAGQGKTVSKSERDEQESHSGATEGGTNKNAKVIGKDDLDRFRNLLSPEDDEEDTDDDETNKRMTRDAMPYTQHMGSGIPGSNSEDVPPEREQAILEAAAEKELAMLFMTPDDSIRGYQQQFVNDFPFEKMYGHQSSVTEETIMKAKQFLQGDDITRAAISLLNFLYIAYVAPLSTQQRSKVTVSHKEEQFTSLFVMLITLLESRKNQGQNSLAASSSSGSVGIEVPLFILLIRVIVDVHFSSLFPTFCVTPTGFATLQRMDVFTLAILDPTGLQSHLAAVESTPHALRVLHSKRLPPKVSPYMTSPLLQFIIGGTKETVSTEVKALIRPHPLIDAGLKELHAQLTPAVKSKVLQIMLDRKV